MKRLTDKHFSINPPRSIKKCRQDFYVAVEDKLRRLEDIEDELGIPLEIYFKVIKDGYYTRLQGDSPFHLGAIIEHRIYLGLVKNKEGDWELFTNHTGTFRLKDCGWTWALTKEELEK